MTDAELAARLADTAAKMLVALRDSGTLTGKALGGAGDRTADAFLVAALKANRPDDGILCEESADSPARLSKQRVWIVDPLDGTREYADGRDDWAVHVALVVDSVAQIGAVAQPSAGLFPFRPARAAAAAAAGDRRQPYPPPRGSRACRGRSGG